MKPVTAAILIILFCSKLYSQAAMDQKVPAPEKIYLQLNSTVFTKDNSIWFKAIVVDSKDHQPTDLSGVLYVELINPFEQLLEQKLIKLEDGIGDGFFSLNESYPTGTYLIRAYTAWSRNFGIDFYFKQYIKVFPSSSDSLVNPLQNIKIVEQLDGTHKISATIDPYVLDSLHQKEVKLYISQSDWIDSLLVKRNRDEQYIMEYSASSKTQFVNLRVKTNNQSQYTKTLVLDQGNLDLQFFPEGGSLIPGVACKVGFKALDFTGKGQQVKGEIFNKHGKVVAGFNSNKLGMGSFVLYRVDESDIYTARLISIEGQESIVKEYELPQVAKQGSTLSVAKFNRNLYVDVHSSGVPDDSISVIVSCRKVVYFQAKGRLNQGKLSFTLSENQLPEGVIVFALTNGSGQPLSARMFYNERLDSRINIGITTDKPSYKQREKTVLNIQLKDSTNYDISTNVSVLALDYSEMGEIQKSRQNILSFLLLDSDLKGAIESPGYYFNSKFDHYQRTKDLDALMLTQGWSRYNYTHYPNEWPFHPEAKLKVSGAVTGLHSKKAKTAELTMMTFGKVPFAQTQVTDSLGRFSFDIDDEFGQRIDIVIQSTNKSGKKKDYTIDLDKHEPPAIIYDHLKSVEKIDSAVLYLVQNNVKRKSIEEAFRLSNDILLEEITIEDYQLTPEREEMTKIYGKPDEVISGQSITAAEEKWSWGLYSVLLFNFPDKIRITDTRGFLYAHCMNPEVTLVVIDGIPVLPENYPFIPVIPPSAVKSFEIIEYARGFPKLYMQLFPSVSPLEVPRLGNVIAIYTHTGKGLQGVSPSIGLEKRTIPVFAVSREYYTPKYERLTNEDWIKPDLRAILHWEPSVLLDSVGSASTTFYNSDNIGKVQVVVESINAAGEIGYDLFYYQVERR